MKERTTCGNRVACVLHYDINDLILNYLLSREEIQGIVHISDYSGYFTIYQVLLLKVCRIQVHNHDWFTFHI